MTSYADLVVVGIPTGFLAITIPFVLLGVNTTVAIPAGAIAVVAIMAHALFVNPPRSKPAALSPSGSDIETVSETPDQGSAELS